MGIGVGHGVPDDDWGKLPNPDPHSFKIIRAQSIGRFIVAEVFYPNCTNYEGRKILVFQNITETKLRGMSVLDPHFREEDSSLIARFFPTAEGWKFAEHFCRSI